MRVLDVVELANYLKIKLEILAFVEAICKGENLGKFSQSR